jgi:hypothetical protein
LFSLEGCTHSLAVLSIIVDVSTFGTVGVKPGSYHEQLNEWRTHYENYVTRTGNSPAQGTPGVIMDPGSNYEVLVLNFYRDVSRFCQAVGKRATLGLHGDVNQGFGLRFWSGFSVLVWIQRRFIIGSIMPLWWPRISRAAAGGTLHLCPLLRPWSSSALSHRGVGLGLLGSGPGPIIGSVSSLVAISQRIFTVGFSLSSAPLELTRWKALPILKPRRRPLFWGRTSRRRALSLRPRII